MFSTRLSEHMACLETVRSMENVIVQTGEQIASILLEGGGVYVAGNGGSAADAQHFAAELVGRFECEREAYRAVSLTTDTSILTATGNDYGFEHIFARQLAGIARKGDVFIGISTSGTSANLIRALEVAKGKGVITIGLLGKSGGDMAHLVDTALVVRNENTARIQEAHEFILHFWSEQIEQRLLTAAKKG
jgi:D-sedoheptulose 7-phosphate isomerase